MSKPPPDRIDVIVHWTFPAEGDPFPSKVYPAHWAAVFNMDHPYGPYRARLIGPDGLTSIERELAEARELLVRASTCISKNAPTLPGHIKAFLQPKGGAT